MVVEDLDDDVTPARRGHLALWAAASVGVVLVALVGVLATREPAQNRLASSPLIDEVAPLIEGDTIAGDDFDLDRLQGRWVVVNFFATWCAPCRQEHPELVSFQRRHDQAGDAQVVSVVYGDDSEAVRAFFDENGGDWPVVVGDEGRSALDYGVSGVPESYLVDPSGFVRAKITGGVTSTGLDRILADLQGRGA
ncbi:hypothetical protein BH18ACT4_BH18ACT4_06480 [soil metagenome]